MLLLLLACLPQLPVASEAPVALCEGFEDADGDGFGDAALQVPCDDKPEAFVEVDEVFELVEGKAEALRREAEASAEAEEGCEPGPGEEDGPVAGVASRIRGHVVAGRVPVTLSLLQPQSSVCRK